jgi:hypothetical protein
MNSNLHNNPLWIGNGMARDIRMSEGAVVSHMRDAAYSETDIAEALEAFRAMRARLGLGLGCLIGQ